MSSSRNSGPRGRALLLDALRHLPTPATPWVPFAGVHAGKLLGYDATTLLTDADKLLASLLRVNEVYDPDGQPVVFDLQLEAEILGCALAWAEKAPPSVASHPLGQERRIPDRLPQAHEGRLPVVLEVMGRLREAVAERTALFGLVCGPLTLASHLRGTELFMDMFDDPAYVGELVGYCAQVARRMTDLYLDAGMDVIAIVDPLVSQISPRTFGQFLHEPFHELFQHVRAQGALSSFFVCGDATKNVEAMCGTEPDAIFVDENIHLPSAKEITDRHGITIGGNIPLTTVMLLGTQQDNIKWVVDMLATVDPRNLVLAPGCDMPYDTPVENVIGIAQAVRDPQRYRQMLADYHAPEAAVEVELPRYETLERPLVEVFTLDSDTCAACGYMLGAAERAVAEMGGRVDMAAYKATVRENIARMKALGIVNLPCIAVNGEVVFSSLIPSNRELLAVLEEAVRRQAAG